MENRQIWPAPAKINLFLHIVGKRDDGYHNLQTIFQFLDYGDELSFELNSEGIIRRDYDYGFSEQGDICLRAAHSLKKHASDTAGVSIGLTKNLPMGGGLGGGSSDAATVLIALNQLWGLGLEREKLAKIGLSLGADVPVFVMGQSSWAEGVGERLTPITLSENWVLVINPDICVSTGDIFTNKRLTPRPQMKRIRAFQEASQLHFGDNHLEPIVRAEYPEVDRLFRWLSKFGEPRMSGSGGAIFLPLSEQFSDREKGLEILAQRPPNSSGFVARGINFHPLHEQFL
jgi:4-diphosphocytidyl-2-C-methyl-D-erythritol kinase